MNHLDLFSGIGGFSLAAQRVWGKEHNIIAFCENDKYCQKVLKKHWPDVPIIETIEELTYERIFPKSKCKRLEKPRLLRTDISMRPSKTTTSNKREEIKSHETEAEVETIDLLTGGWPCQPFSVAGKRKGREDDRYLWHEMFRIIQETNPTWIIGENVTGIVNMELDNVLSDLEGEGYETQTFIIPACAVDARHRRDRIWVIANNTNAISNTERGAYRENSRKCTGEDEDKLKGREVGNDTSSICKTLSDSDRARSGTSRSRIDKNKQKENEGWEEQSQLESGRYSQDVADTSSQHDDRSGYGTGEVCREQSGQTKIPGCRKWLPEPNVGRVAHGIPSRMDRLKALGNAIVPQVVEVIMRGIKEIETESV